MRMKWRFGLLAIIAAAVVGGFMPHGVLAGAGAARDRDGADRRSPGCAAAALRGRHLRQGEPGPGGSDADRRPGRRAVRRSPPSRHWGRPSGATGRRPRPCLREHATRSSTLLSSPSSKLRPARPSRPTGQVAAVVTSQGGPLTASASSPRTRRTPPPRSIQENHMSKSTTRPERSRQPTKNQPTKNQPTKNRPPRSSPPRTSPPRARPPRGHRVAAQRAHPRQAYAPAAAVPPMAGPPARLPRQAQRPQASARATP